MAIPRSWTELSSLPLRRLQDLADASLARHLRQELVPFSPWVQRAYRERGLQPSQFRGTGSLEALPIASLEDLAREPEAFQLKANPKALREHWPFGRKLALALSGGKGGEILRQSYGTCAAWQVPIAGSKVWLHASPQCLGALAEAGARSYAVLGLDRPGDRVLLAASPGSPTREAWTLARPVASVELTDTGGPAVTDPGATASLLSELGAAGLIAEAAFAEAVLEAAPASSLSKLRRIVLVGTCATPDTKGRLRELARSKGATEALASNIFTPEITRLIFPEAPAEPESSTGFVLFPDLAHFEVLDTDGELVFTTACQRGTALVRQRLGIFAPAGIDAAECPLSGRSLPRLQGELRLEA